MVRDPRAAIARFAINRKLATRMRNPEIPVRSLKDARSRFLQHDPREIAATFEILQDALENDPENCPIDEETLQWMAQVKFATLMRTPEIPVRSLEDARSRFLQLDPSQIEDTVLMLGDATRNGLIDEGTMNLMARAGFELMQNMPSLDIPAALVELNLANIPPALAELNLGNRLQDGDLLAIEALNIEALNLALPLDDGPLLALGFTPDQLRRIEAQPDAEALFPALLNQVPDLIREGRTLENITQLAIQNPADILAREAGRGIPE